MNYPIQLMQFHFWKIDKEVSLRKLHANFTFFGRIYLKYFKFHGKVKMFYDVKESIL